MMRRPIDVVIERLHGVRGAPPKLRARCPAHGSKSQTLALAEGRDGAVLLRCFAGCAPADIVRAVNLDLADLFPARGPERVRDRNALQRRFERDPRKTLAQALDAERERVRAQLRADLGYDRPWRCDDENEARQRVSRSLGIAEKPATVKPYGWECAPHDSDPIWPTLYSRALEEVMCERWHALHPDASAWMTDPNGATVFDRIRAEDLAREWQRGLCR